MTMTGEPLRIVITVHHHLDPNAGAPGAAWHLGCELRARGHHVEIFSFDDLPARLPARAKELFFPEFAAARFAARERAGLDVVDALTGDAWAWFTVRRDGRRPVLITRSQGLEHVYVARHVEETRARGDRLPLPFRLYHAKYRLREVEISLRRADRAVFLNDDDRTFAVERLGVSSATAVVGRNGIGSQFLRRPFSPLGDGPVRIAQVGTFNERKGIRYGVPALAAVLRRHEAVTASLIGTQRAHADVLAAFPVDVRDRLDVVPTYANDDLPGLLEGHHVKLFPTLAEGAPIVLGETMACGLAPVTTAISGVLAFVEDGRTGLVVPPGDAAALETALERAVADRHLLELLRRAAHEAAQRFGWAEIATETERLYHQALAERRARR